jgi:hypothetical protein
VGEGFLIVELVADTPRIIHAQSLEIFRAQLTVSEGKANASLLSLWDDSIMWSVDRVALVAPRGDADGNS